MSKLILRNLSFLDRLCKCHKKPKGIKDVVKKCSDDEMRAFVEVLFNIMKKNVPISKKLEDVIRLHRKQIVHLIDPKYSLKSKRKYFVQSGGLEAVTLVDRLVKLLANYLPRQQEIFSRICS